MFSNDLVPRRNRLKILKLVWPVLFFCTLIGKVTSLPLEGFYPFGDGNAAEHQTPQTDDGGSDEINLNTPFPFFNKTYFTIYVNNNGIISFDERLNTYKPLNFNDKDFLKTTPALVAPYWSDVDIQNVGNGTIYYRLTNETSVLNRVDKDVRNNFIGLWNFKSKLVLIVTWYQVGFYGAKEDGLNKRNTFQAVLATSGSATFAIFNYNQTEWTTGSNSDGDPFTGLGGKPAVVGFYSGPSGRYYLLDNSGTDDIKNVVDASNVGRAGKYMFRLDGDINDLSCSAKDKLNINPSVVSMLGREVVHVSGPCLLGFDTVKGRILEIHEEFDCRVIDYYAVCVFPSLFRTGELTFQLDAGHGWNYTTKITSVHLLNMPTKLFRSSIQHWLSGRTVTVTWSNDSVPADLEKDLNLMSYTTNEENQPQFITLEQYKVFPRETSRKFKLLSDFNGHSTLVMSLCWQNDSYSNMSSSCIWSDVFPVIWKESNSKESERWCSDWLLSEETKERIDISPQNCPCIVSIAENDVGHFSIDPNCDKSSGMDTKCLYNKNAHKCFRRNNKRAVDSGETCCYDEEGELMDIRFSSGAGTHQRYHYKAQGEGITPYFSYFESDLLPKLHCCQYSDKYCTDFIKYRNATMCQNYNPPSPAQACGDPHLVTLDGKGYSFNGVGNFYLVTDTKSSVVIQVQAVQARDADGDLQNATIFSKVAMTMPGSSDTVEVRMTDDGSDVLVNNITIPTTNSTTSQFKNISLLHKDDGSYLILLEPISVSVSVEVTPDLLNIIVFIGEDSLKGQLRGLLGNYNGKPEDDFISKNETVLPGSIDMKQIHYDFGMTWLVPEYESILSSTIDVNNISYEPVFIGALSDLIAPNDTEQICGDNEPCKFDYLVTRKQSVAQSTAQFTNKFDALKKELDQKVVRCPYLDTPPNGNKTLTGFTEGDTATFTCNENYELITGDYVRHCQGNSEWTGADVVCGIKVKQENNWETIIIVVVAVTCSAGTVFIVIVAYICVRKYRRKQQVNGEDNIYNIPLSTISNIPIFENPVFMKMLQDTTSEGRFKIPRPNYVDPSIFQEYF
ncbi:hypothetical protein ACF0H5_021343 [Mactra antiquata]